MNVRIETIEAKLLIGKSLKMSLTNNSTVGLWKSFMPRRKEIQHSINADQIALQVYPPMYFSSFEPDKEFEKWAAVEVSLVENIPTEMKSFVLEAGKYAVFEHQGMSTEIFNYIFTEWLPGSGFELDNRPHFEILGEKYKQGDPLSEEEIWIPIK
jgi:AraC family transcriptional regulator